jgi:uncharacterized membrane protein YfcA
MSSSFRIGRILGIDVKVHWTFLLLLICFAFLGYRFAQSLTGALISVAVILALFVCVSFSEVQTRVSWVDELFLRAKPAERTTEFPRAVSVVPAPVGHDHSLRLPRHHPLEGGAGFLLAAQET